MKDRLSISLNNNTRFSLPKNVAVPQYDRAKLKTGIVHVGVGGFHRSHQAFYTDNYISETGDTQWGICGVGLRESDRKMQQLLKLQDYLYTLLVKAPSGESSLQVIACMTEFLLGCDDPQKVIEKMADEDTKIVSLTITEGGYNFNPATGEFDFSNPDVKHDIANPHTPKLVFGYLAAALKLRRDRGKSPFTVQSCDNVQHNGDMARKVLVTYIKAFDKELAAWVESEVAFPNAMVDRITPATTQEDITEVEQLGVVDAWPVTCEPFCQWVIEDKFTQGRPQWELFGAQFVADVTPYETMKIRLLNAGHTVLGMLGSLQGYETIDQTVCDPVFSKFLRSFMDIEVTPVLAPVAGIDLDEYKSILIERFSNPNIKDSLTRICSESSSKVPTFLVPTIAENIAGGGEISRSLLVLAAWCWYSDKGKDQLGNQLSIIDEQADTLHEIAMSTSSDTLAFLRQKALFGELDNNLTVSSIYQQLVIRLYQGTPIKTLMEDVLSNEVSL